MQLRFLLIMLLVIGQTSFSPIASANFEGAFPGRGSYEGWQKANLEYYKGVELQEDGKIEDAQASFDLATKIYRFDSRYWNSLGICRQQEKGLPDAEQAFRTGIEVNPGDKQSWLCLKNLLHLEGRDAEAKTLEAKMQRIDSSPPGIENPTEWHEKQEKDQDSPLTLLKKFVGN